MKSGDILTVIGGIAIVVVIALAANPQYLQDIVPKSIPGISPTVPATPAPTKIILTPPPTPTPEQANATTGLPYRIFYSDKPLSYPVFRLPENMETFGASDIPFRTSEIVTFAFAEDTRGGITRTFTVPYPVWMLNTTVTANITPQYGSFRMVLCYAENGTVIEGQEIKFRGNAYHVVQVSNTPMYMIISTSFIDRYRIELQTPRSYYDQYKPRSG